MLSVFRVGSIGFRLPRTIHQSRLFSSSLARPIQAHSIRSFGKNDFRGTNRIMNKRFMATSIEIPPLGDSITEATVVEFVKNVGDAVQADEVLAIIETDKVSIDIYASAGGTIEEILVGEGDTVIVGQKIITLDGEAVAVEKSASPVEDSTPVASSPSDSPPSETVKSSGRVPLIRFRYGPQPPVTDTPSLSTSSPSPPIEIEEGTIMYESYSQLPARYHRQKGFTEEQMRMIDSGGAEPENYSYPY